MKNTYMHIYLNVVQPFFKEWQHLWEFVVRVHIVHGAAALLQQADDVLILDLLVHLELLEGGAQRLEKWAEVIVVGEVGFWQLWKTKKNKFIIKYDVICVYYLQYVHIINIIISTSVGTIRYCPVGEVTQPVV